jgi:hypothetical protein
LEGVVKAAGRVAGGKPDFEGQCWKQQGLTQQGLTQHGLTQHGLTQHGLTQHGFYSDLQAADNCYPWVQQASSYRTRSDIFHTDIRYTTLLHDLGT